MRRAIRALIVTALIALPFGAFAAPAAHAECNAVGPVVVCNEGMGDVEVPGIVRVCLRFAPANCANR